MDRLGEERAGSRPRLESFSGSADAIPLANNFPG
jgi:hypothetical protein